MSSHRSIPTPGIVGALLLLLARSAFGCESGDTPIFSCDAAGGRKYIELCAASPMDPSTGFLQYRFGAQDADGNTRSVDLAFPARREGSLRQFYGSTYTTRGVYTQSIRFETHEASYRVFTESTGSATTAAGVRVTLRRTGRTSTIACSERPRFYIHELEDVVACDPATPVGRACIK
jgi:hypothetical protein